MTAKLIRRLSMGFSMLALLLAGLVWTAPNAYAGGPTSVLVADPQHRRVVAAYYDQTAYGKLVEVTTWAKTGAEIEAPADGDAGFATEIRLTWLIHDVSVWRVDRIHPDADGGWLVETVESFDDGTLAGKTPVWHRIQNPAELQAALTEVGLTSAPAPTRTSSSPSTPSQPPVTSSLPPVTPSSAPIGFAAVGGLLVGAVATALVIRRPRRAP